MDTNESPVNGSQTGTDYSERRIWLIVRVVAVIVVIAEAVWVTFSPQALFAPTQRTVLFFLISLVPALLLGEMGSATLEVKGKMKALTFGFFAVGAIAVFFAALWSFDTLSKPEEQIAVYQIFDSKGSPITLNPRRVKDPVGPRGLTVTTCVKDTHIFMIFPEQVGEVRLDVEPLSNTHYAGMVSYVGSRKTDLILGADLTRASE